MKKLNKFSITYFLVILPFLLLGMIFDVGPTLFAMAGREGIYQVLNNLLGILFGLWIFCALYLSISLLVSSTFREELLLKIVRLRERDEREVLEAGQISKKVFLNSMAVMVFLLVASMLQVVVQKIPAEQQMDGKGHTLQLGLKFSVWNTEPLAAGASDQLFNYHFPFSGQGILILILAWQILTFHLYSRRLARED